MNFSRNQPSHPGAPRRRHILQSAPMNFRAGGRHALTWLRVASLCAALTLMGGARVCVADDTIPASIKTASDPAAASGPISQFFTAEFPKLLDDTHPDDQSAARDALVGEAQINGAAGASAAFLQAYGQQLNTLVLASLKNPATSIRARVNIAIVTARAAALLLHDKLMPIQLWGLRAAQSIVLAGLQNPMFQEQPLMTAIINVVGPDSTGVVVVEAYRAVMAGYPSQPFNPALVPFVQQLLQKRLSIYAQTDPPSPDTDSIAILFLANTIQPGANVTPQIKSTLSLIADLISLAGQRGGKAKDPTEYIQLLGHIQTALNNTLLANDSAALSNVLNNIGAAATQASDAIINDSNLGGPLPAAPTIHDADVRGDAGN
jgi:hypothetical protein